MEHATISGRPSVSLDRQSRSGLVGRGSDLASVRALVDAAALDGRGHVQMVIGETGIGKTALLTEAIRAAVSVGVQVLSTSGDRSEAGLSYAALHKLLHDVPLSGHFLPEHQEEALRRALGLVENAMPEPYLVGVAAFGLFSHLAENAPVLVVVDDAHWLDQMSLDVLSFVGRRLAKVPITLLMSRCVNEAAPKVGGVFPELRLGRLGVKDSNALLDTLLAPPQGRMRAQVLAQSEGNPGALVELANLVASDSTLSRKWSGAPLPVPEHVLLRVDSKLTRLPTATQDLLLLVAAALDGDLLYAAEGGTNILDADLLTPGEQVGLIKIGPMGIDFENPLTRFAIYHIAPFASRAAAHRRLAAVLRHEPDRQAWHLAAASLAPHEHLACLLEVGAGQAKQRGGIPAAALMMERAAELSPKREQRARRFISAAEFAASTGQVAWVRELADRALSCATQPAVQLSARRWIGWSWSWSDKRDLVLTGLLSVVRESADNWPSLAWDALGTAASVAYQSGLPWAREEVLQAFDKLEAGACTVRKSECSGDDELTRVWIEACLRPDRRKIQAGSALAAARAPDACVEKRATAGMAAWALDQLELSLDLLRDVRERLQSSEVRGASADVLATLAWAYVDAGRWDEALITAEEASALAAAHDMAGLAVNAEVVTAMVSAMKGDVADARAHADQVLSTRNPAESAAMMCQLRRALGLAAMAEGNHLLAYAQLRRLFDAEGVPLHQHLSYLGVADLASAALRADRVEACKELIDRTYADLGPTSSTRVEQLFAHANGILAGPDRAELYFEKALSVGVMHRWPFEFAQLQLDYAQWLRRQRRISESKLVLLEAVESLRQLGAAPWVRRAESELRACGLGIGTASDGLSTLTSREQEIVNLASSGLTNREIGERLFLSARTVSSHLYRTYPKLGVTSRFQLRDLLVNSDAQ
jgi:DNA-binding CsgD family transcriptional regulator